MSGHAHPASNDELVDNVSERRNYLGIDSFDVRALNAMRRIDRAAFCPPEAAHEAYEDEPVKIGHNQTCSQPSMVAAMATVLDLRPGLRVLEIGTGSGYSAAVTSQMISPGGHLTTVEIIDELNELALNNIASLDFKPGNIELIIGDGSEGHPHNAPYDRIYFTAGAGKYFNEKPLLEQLAIGGTLVYPEAFGSLFLLKKTPAGVRRIELKGVGFVYLKGKNSGFE